MTKKFKVSDGSGCEEDVEGLQDGKVRQWTGRRFVKKTKVWPEAVQVR